MRVTSKHLTNEHEGKTRGGSDCPDECGMVGIAPWCLKISTELPPEASKSSTERRIRRRLFLRPGFVVWKGVNEFMEASNTGTSGIKEDFSEVFESQFSNIYNYVYARILHRERTEDLVSEIFIKAMKHYDSYNPSIASERTWLTNIARNTLIDEYRKSSKAQVFSLDAETEYVEPSEEDTYPIMQNPVNAEAQAILSKLNDSERELIAMIYFQNLSNPEIGEILGINAKAVSERHRRLLAKCRKLEAGKSLSDFL